MASETIATDDVRTQQRSGDGAAFWSVGKAVLAPLASLKLTVVLFALAIFLIFAGTFAQVDKDIWQVIREYFRTPWVWIPFQIFFPPSFFPSRPVVPGGIPYPGGWAIGAAMVVNLLAAHTVRFKVQARGGRLRAGLAMIGLGLAATWLVVASGSNKDGVQSAAWLDWATIWRLFIGALGLIWIGAVYSLLRLGRQQTVERWVLIPVIVGLGGLLAVLLYQGDAARFDDSSMRILWQLTKATAAGVVLLAGCWLAFKKRAGIVLLHAGVGLMMFGEVLVGAVAEEAQMQLGEGQTVSHVQDIRELELAVIDPSHPQHDHVVAVPESVLLAGGTIQDDALPFDIEVVKFLQNARLRRALPADENPATTGVGRQWMVDELKPGSGTDSGGAVDMSAGYVRLLDKKTSQSLGTHLVSLAVAAQGFPETVTVDGKSHDLYLRFKRIYKPYSVRLIDVRKDDYLGTDTPRNYSSDIHLTDASRNVDREIKIWMNNPLRYAGETFYQSGYHIDPQTGIEGTTLAVVTNTGWMIPYVGCMIVAVGMLFQFSVTLLRYLNRQMGRSSDDELAAPAPRNDSSRGDRAELEPAPSMAARWFPVVVVLVLGGWMLSKARAPSPDVGAMQLYEFGKLPVVYQGRVKPIDTLARNSLRIISGKQTFDDEQDREQPAIRWLLDVVAQPQAALGHKVFRIDHPEVLDTLDLQRRKGYRYSFAEFQDRFQELTRQAALAHQSDPDALSLYQKKILELESKIGVLDLLVQSFAPPNIRSESVKDDLFEAIRQQQALARRHPPLAVPPETESEEQEWRTYATAWTRDLIHSGLGQGAPSPAAESLTRILSAYAEGDAGVFNSEVSKYQRFLAVHQPGELDTTKTNFETFFNQFEPFYHAAVLYFAAFVLTSLGAISWIGWSTPLKRAAFWLIVFTFAVHTFALIARIYISGRPPVTNLYSSAVFIGWAGVLFGLVIERIARLGIGNALAAEIGFSTLLIAHQLAGDGDTFIVLQAVLDTQFWLATHVVCVTLGYAATFAAGALAILYVLRGIVAPVRDALVNKELSRSIYGVLCFALFFSFFGTVLGGLWADDSWGRFWGWDPKENGALIIVLWNALVLHARWGGWVRERGTAVLAVGGNIVTAWSWFGVNELGVGLHSYGFTEGVLMALGLFIASQLAIIALGLVPQTFWLRLRPGGGADAGA